MRLFLILSVCLLSYLVNAEEKARSEVVPSQVIKKDNAERTVQTTDKDGFVAEVTFDEQDNQIRRKDKNGNIWRYTYNEHKQCIREDKPDGTSVFYEFDSPKAKQPTKETIIRPEDTLRIKAG
jgi:YD repeat-containing protein